MVKFIHHVQICAVFTKRRNGGVRRRSLTDDDDLDVVGRFQEARPVGGRRKAQRFEFEDELGQYKFYRIRTLVLSGSRLMVNTHGVIRLFHHFHHDADDGLNDGTNALWALMGAGGFAAAMAVDTKQVVERHIGTPFDWSRMLSWNSTSDVLAAINESLTTRAQVSGVSTGATREAEPAGTLPTATRGRPKKGSGTKHRAKPSKPVEASEDDTDDVTVVGFTMKPTVPVPAFIAAAIMDTYVTAPEELALLIVNAIKQRASEDPDPSRATIRAEAASYIRGGSSA
ncbi:hypothetical protein MHU86_4917 [Fragilaria crotonensis]|nr:hypothetical protein MHU86_4917 [Fragilaria crotonensis]